MAIFMSKFFFSFSFDLNDFMFSCFIEKQFVASVGNLSICGQKVVSIVLPSFFSFLLVVSPN